MRGRLLLLCAVAAIAAGTISACGGSGGSSGNGIASKSADQIFAAATKAIDAVKSLHVHGTVSSGGHPTALDLHLVSGTGATGTFTQGTQAFKLIEVNDTVYIAGNKAFLLRYGGSQAAVQLLEGKWFRGPADSGQFASFHQLTDLKTLLAGLLSGHGTLTKGPASTVDGTKVVSLKDAKMDGTLYVATTGKPYPIEVSKTGSNGGSIAFSDFNAAVSIKPPASSIDISQLQSK